jgi:hypothetical protein
MLPALSPVTALPDLASQPEYRFLHAQMVREVNRLSTTLQQAVQVIEGTLATA